MEPLFSLLYQVGIVLMITTFILISFAAVLVLFSRRNAGRQEELRAGRFYTGTQSVSQEVLLDTKRA